MHYQSVCLYWITLSTVICVYVVNHRNTILYVRALVHHLNLPGKSVHFVHVPCEPPKMKSVGDIDHPCEPWCTMPVGGALGRSVVYNVVLYHWGRSQHRSHKPWRTDNRQMGATKECGASITCNAMKSDAVCAGQWNNFLTLSLSTAISQKLFDRLTWGLLH